MELLGFAELFCEYCPFLMPIKVFLADDLFKGFPLQ